MADLCGDITYIGKAGVDIKLKEGQMDGLLLTQGEMKHSLAELRCKKPVGVGISDKEKLECLLKAQLGKVEDWLREELKDPENEPYYGFIGYLGLTIRGERLRE